MPTTSAGRKAGRREAEAIVRWMIDLDDPEAEGNLGGLGFDDEAATRHAPNAGLARHWAEQVMREQEAAGHRGVLAEVRVGEWVRDEFDDADYGHVVDAYWQVLTVQTGQLREGAVEWDDPEPA